MRRNGSPSKNDDEKPKGWGSAHSRADREINNATNERDNDLSRGRPLARGTLHARGEAITNRADLKHAADNARKHGGN